MIVGLTAGMNTVLAPMYLSEIAPVSLRGGIGVLNQLAVTVGLFISQVKWLRNTDTYDGWAWLIELIVVKLNDCRHGSNVYV